MINAIFGAVAYSLYATGRKVGLTYNEMNIIVYYLIVPLTWTVMIDCLIGWPITTALLMIAWAVTFMSVRKRFSAWCDWAFKKSVDFLLWFRHLGWNYCLASVIICVAVPLAIYIALFSMLCHRLGISLLSCALIIGGVLAVCLLSLYIILKFGIRLVPQKEFTSMSYPLTSDEKQKIYSEVSGMSVNEIVRYALIIAHEEVKEENRRSH